MGEDGEDVVVAAFDPLTLGDQELAEYHAFANTMQAESNPEDPPVPLEVFGQSVRWAPSDVDRWGWFVRSPDSSLVAVATARSHPSGENAEVMYVQVSVLSPWRRRGIGWRCLRLATELAETEGKARLMGWTGERVPAGAAFCEAVGAESGLAEHLNRLVLAELDRDLLRQWVESGTSRAGDAYRLVGYDGRCPDDLIDAVVEVLDVMADAPRGDLRMGHRQTTVAEMREWEELSEKTGTQGWWLFAQEKATGRLVGLTAVWWNPFQPQTVGQGDTGVLAEHRGRGLGKWLKAAMLERILRERPDVVDVRTGNADSNVPMLDINHRLGFKPYIAHTGWQLELDRAKERLQTR